MTTVKQAWHRFLSVFRKDRLDQEFDEELAAHILLAADEFEKGGMPPAEARRRAHLEIGGVESVKETHRDSRGLPWLEGVIHDLRFAVRGLRRDYGFTLTAIVTLALALGLNGTVFAVVDTMLFRGFPLVKDNDRLLYMQQQFPTGQWSIIYPDLEEWRAEAESFEEFALVAGGAGTFNDGQGATIDTFLRRVSANTFHLLGVKPILGRDFTPEDAVPGAPEVLILGHRFWETQFDRRTDIIGHVVRINDVPATVIGVMPEGFDFPEVQDFWMPIQVGADTQSRTPNGHLAFGRLKDGATIAGARTEMATLARREEADHPDTNHDAVLRVETHAEFFIGPDAGIVYGTLWAAAWFVLLIACANLTNLSLARTIGRSREFATRMALGAGPWRMMRQIAVEGLLLAGAGGVIAWWIGKYSVRTWAAATASRYVILDYTLDAGTMEYLALVAICAALLFSVVPMWKVYRLGVGHLNEEARGTTRGRHHKRLAAVLVAGQMALAIVLLAGAGVLVRSLLNVVRADSGVRDPERVLTGYVSLPAARYASPQAQLAYFERLQANVQTVPGAEAVSVANLIPVGNTNSREFEIEGRPVRPGYGEAVQFIRVSSDYFQSMGLKAQSGRTFDRADREGRAVALVNQAFVDRYWPGEAALEQHLRAVEEIPEKYHQWRTVVGVVPNIMQGDSLRQRFLPIIYIPFEQAPMRQMQFFARANVPAEQVAPAVREKFLNLDADVNLEDFMDLESSFAFDRDRMDLQHAEMGKHAAVAPIFAGIALLLAAIGLYAVTANSISQRTKEIGVRMAIGAAARDIRGLIFREGMLPVVTGLVLGIVASLAVNRVLESQLVGVSPYDVVTYAGAALIMILVALLACQIPSRRAMRVDPAIALREE